MLLLKSKELKFHLGKSSAVKSEANNYEVECAIKLMKTIVKNNMGPQNGYYYRNRFGKNGGRYG